MGERVREVTKEGRTYQKGRGENSNQSYTRIGRCLGEKPPKRGGLTN